MDEIQTLEDRIQKSGVRSQKIGVRIQGQKVRRSEGGKANVEHPSAIARHERADYRR